MQNLFSGFKSELAELRKRIEQDVEFDYELLISDLSDSIDKRSIGDDSRFYREIILYRLKEKYSEKKPKKEELLQLLSLWAISL